MLRPIKDLPPSAIARAAELRHACTSSRMWRHSCMPAQAEAARVTCFLEDESRAHMHEYFACYTQSVSLSCYDAIHPGAQQQGPGVALPALQRRLRRYSKTACPASGEHAAEALAPDKTTKNLCTPRIFEPSGPGRRLEGGIVFSAGLRCLDANQSCRDRGEWKLKRHTTRTLANRGKAYAGARSQPAPYRIRVSHPGAPAAPCLLPGTRPHALAPAGGHQRWARLPRRRGAGRCRARSRQGCQGMQGLQVTARSASCRRRAPSARGSRCRWAWSRSRRGPTAASATRTARAAHTFISAGAAVRARAVGQERRALARGVHASAVEEADGEQVMHSSPCPAISDRPARARLLYRWPAPTLPAKLPERRAAPPSTAGAA